MSSLNQDNIARIAADVGLDQDKVREVLRAQRDHAWADIDAGRPTHIFGLGWVRPITGDGKVVLLQFYTRRNGTW